jgi:hypothetical protein
MNTTFAKVNREKCLREYKNFPTTDNLGEEAFFPEVYKRYFLSVAKEPKTRYIGKMSVAVAGLIRELGYGALIFIGDGKRPWLHRYQQSACISKSIDEAIQYFKTNQLGKRFNGALKVNTSELSEFVRHTYWLTSPNAALSIFHFMDEGQNILGNICQYGIIHFYTLNSVADDLFNKIVNDKPTFLFRTECHTPYGK